MKKDWSQLTKTMQLQLKKEDSFKDGIETLFTLRNKLTDVIFSFRNELSRDDFDAMPYINAEGYHSKNIGYSLWHIFRIEDIVAHSLIQNDRQIFFSGNYKERIGSPIITTGNELEMEQIANFSRQLDIDELYSYISDVKSSTESILKELPYSSLKKKMPPESRENLVKLAVVSNDEKAEWLIDYWCGKDIRDLIQMPFSRHWIMHIEASLRIKDKLNK